MGGLARTSRQSLRRDRDRSRWPVRHPKDDTPHLTPAVACQIVACAKCARRPILDLIPFPFPVHHRDRRRDCWGLNRSVAATRRAQRDTDRPPAARRGHLPWQCRHSGRLRHGARDHPRLTAQNSGHACEPAQPPLFAVVLPAPAYALAPALSLPRPIVRNPADLRRHLRRCLRQCGSTQSAGQGDRA